MGASLANRDPQPDFEAGWVNLRQARQLQSGNVKPILRELVPEYDAGSPETELHTDGLATDETIEAGATVN